MKLQSEIQAEYRINGVTIGEVFTTERFFELVDCGLISPNDGIGMFHNGYSETDISVWDPYQGEPDCAFGSVWEEFPYVVWYNK